MNFPRVSLIILNWNGLQDTIKCLDSLRKITYPNYEVLAVDNGSKGDDYNALTEKYGAYIRGIKIEENCGFSAANNVAIRKVLEEGQSKYILLLNNDTVVKQDFLTNLVEAIEENPKIGAVTPKILNPDGSLQRSNRKFPTPFLTFLSFCVPKSFLSNGVKIFFAEKTVFRKFLGKTVDSYFWSFYSNKPKEIENASGACLLLRKEAILDIGLMDEKMIAGANDVDLCYRIVEGGWKIFYIPKSEILHYVGKSFKTKEVQCAHFCQQVQVKQYYTKKHRSKFELLQIRLILLIAMIIRLPQFFYYSFCTRDKEGLNLWSLYGITFKNIILNKTL